MSSLLNEFIEKKEPHGNVALFIDNDNLFESGKNYYYRGRQGYDFEVLVRKAKEYGHLVVAHVYGKTEKVAYEFFKLGVEPVHTPYYRDPTEGMYKSLSDSMMICDIVSALYEKPEIDVFIIASGDKDFIPVLFKLYKHKKQVFIIGFEETAANDLIKIADNLGFKFLDLNYKISERTINSGGYEKQANQLRIYPTNKKAKKRPKVRLSELERCGLIKEGQKLIFCDKKQKCYPEEYAFVEGSLLRYLDGELYSPSSLAKK